MNYKQALNYLKSSGMSEEQIKTVVNAIKSELIENILDTYTYSLIDYMADLLIKLKEEKNV